MAKDRSCETCLHRCMEPDCDIYCSAVNEPWGQSLTRGRPVECGPLLKLWEQDTRGARTERTVEKVLRGG